jgi:hypothetical protein
MHQRVKNRQETVNERLKNWAILVTPFHHNFHLHKTVFAAVIALLHRCHWNINIPLFSVEYNDYTLTASPVKTCLDLARH